MGAKQEDGAGGGGGGGHGDEGRGSGVIVGGHEEEVEGVREVREAYRNEL